MNDTLNIKFLDPKTLIPAENNPKEHPDDQVEAIARSIKNFGFDQPIVVDQTLEIIKGHGRVLAAIKLGMSVVPVIVRDVEKAEAALNRILDNHLTSQDYDQYSLREDLMLLKATDMLHLTGLTDAQIPDLYKVVSKVDSQLFSLATKHNCPKCQYKW